jgi:hypothetical protein
MGVCGYMKVDGSKLTGASHFTRDLGLDSLVIFTCENISNTSVATRDISVNVKCKRSIG